MTREEITNVWGRDPVVAVASAAETMDQLKPDWWQHIDPLTLNLENWKTCICGQNGLDWRVARDTGGKFTHSPVFAARPFEPYWLEEIAKRTPDREPAKELVESHGR